MQVKVRHGILVRRPPNEVFSFLSNVDNMPQWQSTLHNVREKRNARNAHLQDRTRVHDRRNVLGKDIDSQYEVVEFEQDRKLTLQLVDGPVSFRMQWTLEPADGGTFFAAEGEGDLGDLPMSAVAANRACQHLLEGDLATLRDLVEAQS